MKDKYYIAYIDERHGEFEEYNLDWYGQECTKADEDENGWIENDYMMHRAGSVTEISKGCFDELVKLRALRGTSIGVFEEEKEDE